MSNLYFYDRALCISGVSSCRIFEYFRSAIGWVAQNKWGVDNLFHLLDDLLVGAVNELVCNVIVEKLVPVGPLFKELVQPIIPTKSDCILC